MTDAEQAGAAECYRTAFEELGRLCRGCPQTSPVVTLEPRSMASKAVSTTLRSTAARTSGQGGGEDDHRRSGSRTAHTAIQKGGRKPCAQPPARTIDPRIERCLDARRPELYAGVRSAFQIAVIGMCLPSGGSRCLSLQYDCSLYATGHQAPALLKLYPT